MDYRFILIALCIGLLVSVTACALIRCQRRAAYRAALEAYRRGNYRSALATFSSLRGFRDSGRFSRDCFYRLALADYWAGNYATAAGKLQTLGDYEQALQYLDLCRKHLDGPQTCSVGAVQ